MRVNISQWTRLAALLVVVVSISSTGCSGGWKMPSMKMPWSKKPSESALAGSGPSSLTYPESPASKQTPMAVASAAAGKAPMASTGAPGTANAVTQFGGAKTTPAAFGSPSITGSPVAGYKPPASGAAATANGYQTGPYNTYGQAGAAGALATAGAPARPNGAPANQFSPSAPGTATGYAASNPYAPPPGANPGLPSSQGYGGGLAASSYGAKPSTMPAMPGAPAQQPPANMGQFASSGQPSIPTFNPSATPVGFAAASPVGTHGANPMTNPMPGGQYSPVGTSGSPASAPNGYAQSAPGNPAMGGAFSMPNAQQGYGAPNGTGQVPAQTAGFSNAASNNLSTASYRPGSTSRPTGYNFAPQGSSQVAGASATGGAPAYTAGNTSNPGYSLPPSSTLNR